MMSGKKNLLCCSAAVVWIVLLGIVMPARAGTVLANVGQDYVAGTNVGDTSASVAISDTAGTGSWNYYNANGGGGSAALLTWDTSPGNSGSPGYGTTRSGWHVPAISKNLIFGDGVVTPADEVNVHPGNSNPVEVIASWTAGQSGLMNIAGSFDENGASGNIGFAVRVNGADVFNGTTTREDGFSFLQNILIGDTVDFVVGPNGSYGADESQLNARVTEVSGDVVANLGGDYNETGLPIADTGGAGTWTYYASDNIDIDATTNEQPLSVGAIGGAGNTGYGGGQNGGLNLPAANDGIIFNDGEAPLGDELATHPGDPANLGGGLLENLVMRWTAGTGEAGAINILGNIRNVVAGGDSIDFHILVNGSDVFSVTGAGIALPIEFFDVNATVAVGDTVDFVIANNGNLFGDESIVSAFITQEQVVPEPSSLVLAGLGLIGLALCRWRQRRR